MSDPVFHCTVNLHPVSYVTRISPPRSPGVPTGGVAGQMIRKVDADPFHTEWFTFGTINGKNLVSGNQTLTYTDVGAASAAQGLLAGTALQPADTSSGGNGSDDAGKCALFHTDGGLQSTGLTVGAVTYGDGLVNVAGGSLSFPSSVTGTFALTSDIPALGEAGGSASLDEGGHIPLSQIPDSLIGQVKYQGTWDANANNPELGTTPTSDQAGFYWVCSVAGTFQGVDYAVGDWIIDNTGTWGKVENTDAVTMVAGRTGAVVLDSGDIAPRLLYFNPSVDSSFSTLGNWFNDDSFSTPATSIPGPADQVSIAALAASVSGDLRCIYLGLNAVSAIVSTATIVCPVVSLSGPVANQGQIYGTVTADSTQLAQPNTGQIFGWLNGVPTNLPTIPGLATTSTPGTVMPDGSTIQVDGTGKIATRASRNLIFFGDGMTQDFGDLANWGDYSAGSSGAFPAASLPTPSDDVSLGLVEAEYTGTITARSITIGGGGPGLTYASGVFFSAAYIYIESDASGTPLPSDVRASGLISVTSMGAEPALPTGTSGQYFRGDKTLATLPTYTLSGLGGVPTSRTIGGVDLSANRSVADIGAASASHVHSGADITSGTISLDRLANAQNVGDANATITAGKRDVLLTSALTAARAYAWPLASGYPAGARVCFADIANTLTATNTATINRSGSDSINGGTSIVISTPGASPMLISDGVSKWNLDIRGIARGGTGATTAATARTNLGSGAVGDSLFVATTVGGVWTTIGAFGTITASSPASITQIWSNSAVTFTASLVNVTDTSSASSSLLADWQVAGVTKMSLRKDGMLTSKGIIVSNLVDVGNNITGVGITSSGRVAWSSSASDPSASTDLTLFRDGPNILAQRNGTNAQSSRTYTTFTARGAGTTNLECLDVKGVASSAFIIQSMKGSAGGTARDIEFRHGATDTNGVITNGTLVATVKSTGIYGSLPFVLAAYTVSTLPSASAIEGGMARVTDALVYTPGVAAAAGGSVKCGVRSDGTNWIMF